VTGALSPPAFGMRAPPATLRQPPGIATALLVTGGRFVGAVNSRSEPVGHRAGRPIGGLSYGGPVTSNRGS